MINSAFIPKFLESVNGCRKALIVAHQFPDLDAVGSCLALKEFLEAQNIECVIWFSQSLKKGFNVLDGVSVVKSKLPLNYDYDTLYVCDCSNLERVKESHLLTTTNKCVVNIDHHADNTLFGDINIVDTDISSVGELLFYLFEGCDYTHTLSTATNLYTAICFDTGRFAFSNVTHETLHAASICVKHGADPYAVYQFMEESKTVEDFALMKVAMDRLVTDDSAKIAYTTIPAKAPRGHVKVIDIIRQLGGYEVVVVFQELQSKLIKINLRAKGDFDVSAFAQQFDGGGHKKAAGISFDDTLDRAISTLIPKLSTAIKEQDAGPSIS